MSPVDRVSGLRNGRGVLECPYEPQVGKNLLRLSFRPPYDWAQVRHFLAKRALPGIELVDDCSYTRTVRVEKTHAVISVRPIDRENALELRVRGAAPAELLRISSIARRSFDVGSDPALINTAFQSDPLLGSMVQNHPGLRIAGAWDLFECAVRAIVGQQVSVAVLWTHLSVDIAIARSRIFFRPQTKQIVCRFPCPAQRQGFS